MLFHASPHLPHRTLRRGVSVLALATGVVGLAGLGSPASAQCVEGPPSTFTCSGQIETGQVIAAPRAQVTTTPGFRVNTTNNGNGLALRVFGTGLVSYEDVDESLLIGAGVRIQTTGDDGQQSGALKVFSNGRIVADGSSGLRLENAGSGAGVATWLGRIFNTGGNGVLTLNAPGSSSMGLTVGQVAGRDHGILMQYSGEGAAGLIALGEVTGLEQSGIRINAGPNASQVDVEVGDVTGGTSGIRVGNDGVGQTFIMSDGLVIGLGQQGILAQAGPDAGRVMLIVEQVVGRTTGIEVEHLGSGLTSLTATGPVIGGDIGIRIDAGANSDGVILDVASVKGQQRAIQTRNFGSGNTLIDVSGVVEGAGDGVVAVHQPGAGDIVLQAVDITAGGTGIRTLHSGTGSTSIVTTGAVIADFAAIDANAFAGAGDLEIDAFSAVGRLNGLLVRNEGLGDAKIIVRDRAEGQVTAVNVEAGADQNTLVNNFGLIRNASGLSSDRAVRATGGLVTINNWGTLLGSVGFDADNLRIINRGVWNSIGGSNFFDGLDDRLENETTGVLLAAVDAATAETTLWGSLEGFGNDGVIRMIDGESGDRVLTSAATLFNAGSVLSADVGGSAGADVFRTSRTLALLPGALLSVNISAPLELNGRYVVAEASNGLTGEFAFEDQFLTAFAGLRDGYTATTAFVEFAQLRDLADAGITPNQKETAAGADSLPDGNALKDALILLPDDDAAIDAFDQLSGEIHPSARTAVVEVSRMPRDAVLDRLSDEGRSSSAWAHAYGSTGQSDGDFNAARMDRELTGFVVGADRALGDQFMVGFAVGSSKTDIDVDRRSSEGSVESVEGLAYAGARFGDWRVSGGVGYAQTSTEARRDIAFPGFAASAVADYDGTVLQGFVEAGYRFAASGGRVEPFANLTAIQVRTDAFAEQGGGEAGLTGEEAREDMLVTTLGLRFETNAMGALSLGGSTGWRHTSGDVDPAGRHAFAGGAPFTVLGAARSDDAAFARVEARWRLSPSMSIGLAYDGTLGTAGEDHAITGGFNFVF